MLYTTINGTEYPLAATLRVAYEVQGQNNHTAYSTVFSDINKAPLEKQIEVLYIAYKCANKNNPELLSKQAFLDYYLDNYTTKEVMAQLSAVTLGILGIKKEDILGSQELKQEASEGN